MCPKQSGSGSSAALYSCTNSVQNSPISQLEPRSSTVSIFLRSSSLAVPPTKPGSKPRPKPWATCAKCASLSRQQNVHWSLPNLVEARDIMQLTDEGSDSILEGRLASCSECVWQDHLASSAKPKKEREREREAEQIEYQDQDHIRTTQPQPQPAVGSTNLRSPNCNLFKPGWPYFSTAVMKKNLHFFTWLFQS